MVSLPRRLRIHGSSRRTTDTIVSLLMVGKRSKLRLDTRLLQPTKSVRKLPVRYLIPEICKEFP